MGEIDLTTLLADAEMVFRSSMDRRVDFTQLLGAGVYLLKDEQGNIVYVGQASNLIYRISSPIAQRAIKFSSLEIIFTKSEEERNSIEGALISKLQPIFNVIGTTKRAKKSVGDNPMPHRTNPIAEKRYILDPDWEDME